MCIRDSSTPPAGRIPPTLFCRHGSTILPAYRALPRPSPRTTRPFRRQRPMTSRVTSSPPRPIDCKRPAPPSTARGTRSAAPPIGTPFPEHRSTPLKSLRGTGCVLEHRGVLAPDAALVNVPSCRPQVFGRLYNDGTQRRESAGGRVSQCHDPVSQCHDPVSQCHDPVSQCHDQEPRREFTASSTCLAPGSKQTIRQKLKVADMCRALALTRPPTLSSPMDKYGFDLKVNTGHTVSVRINTAIDSGLRVPKIARMFDPKKLVCVCPKDVWC
eukprot:TRINITY_DN4947_c0_g2_i19.p1 TRINITY_DN4947_c0_g2~~TRINITY_DN4947_c0_g2_i19.p1  ORF type:complete len:271 (+),score=9.72 TRINITY_DN4947_c0_g2_i19:156-968(+)